MKDASYIHVSFIYNPPFICILHLLFKHVSSTFEEASFIYTYKGEAHLSSKHLSSAFHPTYMQILSILSYINVDVINFILYKCRCYQLSSMQYIDILRVHFLQPFFHTTHAAYFHVSCCYPYYILDIPYFLLSHTIYWIFHVHFIILAGVGKVQVA